jgi:hypothetical protein
LLDGLSLDVLKYTQWFIARSVRLAQHTSPFPWPL